MSDTMPRDLRDIRGLATLVVAEKRRRGRRKAIGKAAQVAATILVINAAHGWVFMLLVALVHEHWLRAVPTIGYLWAALLVLAGKTVLPGLFVVPRDRTTKMTAADP